MNIPGSESGLPTLDSGNSQDEATVDGPIHLIRMDVQRRSMRAWLRVRASDFEIMIQSIMVSILQINIIDDCSRNSIHSSVVSDRARHLESKQDSDESHAVDTVMIRSKYHR